MDLLLDTHVFLWWNADATRVPAAMHSAIADPANRVFVSAASVWEIAIKRVLGRLRFHGGVVQAIQANRFLSQPIMAEHAERAGALPRHHDDPFDRVLVAQAEIEGQVLATLDYRILAYGVATLAPGAPRPAPRP